MAAQDRSAPKLGREDDLAEEQALEQNEGAQYDYQYDTATPEQLEDIAAHGLADRRIFILGVGSIGKLVAHSVRTLPKPPPVTLLLHREGLLKAWERSRKVVTLREPAIGQDGVDTEASGFEVELALPPRRQHGVQLKDGMPSVYDLADDEGGIRPHEVAKIVGEELERQQGDDAGQGRIAEGRNSPGRSTTQEMDGANKAGTNAAVSDEPIHSLIVTTKTIYTIPALSSIKHRLNRKSTICFLQNGMGVIDEVNESIFPDEEDRPSYIQGIISHGANVPPEIAERDPFYAVHAGQGTVALGLLPRTSTITSGDDQTSTASNGRGAGSSSSITGANDTSVSPTRERWPESARHLLRTLTRSPALCAVGMTPSELLQQQLEKLAVNSVLNPLTSLIDARNGNILYNFPLTRLMRLMLAETSLIFRSLPELQGIPNIQHRFSPEKLETLVVGVANKTAENVSSMLADVRGGRKTEVEFINGYIVRRGEELGIKAVVNYGIMNAVAGKSLITQREAQGEVPMVKS